NGATWSGPTTYNSSNWRTAFNGSPTNFTVGVPTVQLPIPMTNSHVLIEIPATNDATTIVGQSKLYNLAQVIILISNTSVTKIIHKRPSDGQLPGEDTTATAIPHVYTFAQAQTNLSFLTTTNLFKDQREK